MRSENRYQDRFGCLPAMERASANPVPPDGLPMTIANTANQSPTWLHCWCFYRLFQHAWFRFTTLSCCEQWKLLLFRISNMGVAKENSCLTGFSLASVDSLVSANTTTRLHEAADRNYRESQPCLSLPECQLCIPAGPATQDPACMY